MKWESCWTWSVLSFEDPSWLWPILLQGEGIYQRQFISEDELLSWFIVKARPLIYEHTQTLVLYPCLKRPIITSCPRLVSRQTTELSGYERWKQRSDHQVIKASLTGSDEGEEVQKEEIIRHFGSGSPLSELKLFLHAAWIPSGLLTMLTETKCSLLWPAVSIKPG